MAIITQITGSDFMLLSEMATTDLFETIEKPILTEATIGSIGVEDCPPVLTVFVDPTDLTNFDTNDRFDVIGQEVARGSFVNFELWKDGVKIEDLNDNSFGTFYDVGYWTEDNGFNEAQSNQTGYQGKWSDVYTAHGLGCYNIVTVEDLPFFPEPVVDIGCCFELKKYSVEEADETFTVRAVQNGKIIKETVDFTGLNWVQHYRMPGFFGFPARNLTETNFITKSRTVEQIQDEIVNDYTLEIYFLPDCIKLKLDSILLANNIIFTDYNVDNACEIRNLPTKWKGEEEVEYFGKSKKIAVTLTFEERNRQTIKRNVR
jgi:hypothetical protein